MDIRKRFQIHSNTLKPMQGNLLLSEPTMNDFHFGRSVVLLIDHSESEGSFGIIMNKSLNMKLKDVVDVFDDFDAPVYLGGPVADNQIFFMHTLGDLIPDSYKIMEGLYWGGNAETLNAMMAKGIADKNRVRFFLGYSGWDSGQLVKELESNSWLVCNTNSKTLFSTPIEEMWETYVSRMGHEYEMWTRFPKNPEEN